MNHARIEIYCPVDYYGFQFVKMYSEPAFLYSNCSRGFDVFVELVTSNKCGFHALEITNTDRCLTSWLENLEREVNDWLANAKKGSVREFEGIDDAFQLRATLKCVCPNPDIRFVEFTEPSRSNDTRLFFEEPMTVEDTVQSQIGKKIGSKLEKHQCGEWSPDYIRILVIDLSLMDACFSDWFCWPSIAKRMDETVRRLAGQAEPPPLFDVVIPARLGFNCCFGEVVVLDQEREAQIRAVIGRAGLDRKCEPTKVEPPDHELSTILEAAFKDH